MSQGLKNCPFCGNHDVFTYNYGGLDFFGCHTCGACVTFKNVQYEHRLQVSNPFESWNRREVSGTTKSSPVS